MASDTVEVLKILTQLPAQPTNSWDNWERATKADAKALAAAIEGQDTQIHTLQKQVQLLTLNDRDMIRAGITNDIGTMILFIGMVVLIVLVLYDRRRIERRIKAMEIDLLAAGIEAPSCHGVKA